MKLKLLGWETARWVAGKHASTHSPGLAGWSNWTGKLWFKWRTLSQYNRKHLHLHAHTYPSPSMWPHTQCWRTDARIFARMMKENSFLPILETSDKQKSSVWSSQRRNFWGESIFQVRQYKYIKGKEIMEQEGLNGSGMRGQGRERNVRRDDEH